VAASCVAPLFVTPATSRSSGDEHVRQSIVRGTISVTESRVSPCTAATWCYAGVALGGLVVAAARHQRSHSFRSGSAASQRAVAGAEEVPEEVPEEPPAPPPFDPSKQVGAMEPLGFFDPLGFTKVGDEEGFRNLQASEIKHGRVAMMASIGLVGQHFIKFPGFEKTPAGFAALGTGEGALGFIALVCTLSILELAWRQEDDREPGNFGDPFGVNMYTEEMRLKEISNGRMAMISVFGIFGAELATGKDAVQQLGL